MAGRGDDEEPEEEGELESDEVEPQRGRPVRVPSREQPPPRRPTRIHPRRPAPPVPEGEPVEDESPTPPAEIED